MQLTTIEENKQPKTEVGSYFVSNNPPFSAWCTENKPAVLAALDSPPDAARLGLYLHIPFCRKRCKFCYFRVYTDKNARDIETYLNAIVKEVQLLAERPRDGVRTPQH